MRELICPVCGKEFKAHSNNQKYCSPECSSIAQKEYQKNYYIAHKANKKARDEYNSRYYYLRKEFGFTSLSELDQCPHDLDCFNCPEADCIMDFGEV